MPQKANFEPKKQERIQMVNIVICYSGFYPSFCNQTLLFNKKIYYPYVHLHRKITTTTIIIFSTLDQCHQIFFTVGSQYEPSYSSFSKSTTYFLLSIKEALQGSRDATTCMHYYLVLIICHCWKKECMPEQWMMTKNGRKQVKEDWPTITDVPFEIHLSKLN